MPPARAVTEHEGGDAADPHCSVARHLFSGGRGVDRSRAQQMSTQAYWPKPSRSVGPMAPPMASHALAARVSDALICEEIAAEKLASPADADPTPNERVRERTILREQGSGAKVGPRVAALSGQKPNIIS
jgi:hypothetical protein